MHQEITRNVPFSNIFLLQNGALWDMGLVRYGICTMGLLINHFLWGWVGWG